MPELQPDSSLHLSRSWLLDPSVLHLNHGSFGATPLEVRAVQDQWRQRLEANPTHFMTEEYEPAIDQARQRLALLIGAEPADLVFVANATTAINAVVRSLSLAPGDELLTTDHAYNACRNVLDYAAARSGADVVTARIPFPLSSPDEVIEPLLDAVTSRTRFALIDHVTSATGLIMPVDRIVASLEQLEIEVLVDGAHAPGMLPLDVTALGCSYYAGNNHKWLCSPKGSGFLWVRPDRAGSLVPPVISHGWNDPRRSRPRLHLLFDYMGSNDPSAHLAVPAAIEFLTSLYPVGLVGFMEANRQLALKARDLICTALGVPEPAPASMIGALATIPLPDSTGEPTPELNDPLTRTLYERHRIQVPVFLWPGWPRRHVRVSAMPYNSPDQYEQLVTALRTEL
ncbi:MAG TPA: aminotransferase class V-fold PLP-dependent enzyme [Acidimicrobiia bacterium]|jgi:isopenicillin-N epimerase